MNGSSSVSCNSWALDGGVEPTRHTCRVQADINLTGLCSRPSAIGALLALLAAGCANGGTLSPAAADGGNQDAPDHAVTVDAPPDLRPDRVAYFSDLKPAADSAGCGPCTSPPPATCVSGQTLRSYAAVGHCAAGTCSYDTTDTPCAAGCAGGACTTPPACAAADLSVPTPYAISGYWLFGRRGACNWRSALETIHRLGADTVIQFGPRPRRRTVSPTGEVLTTAGTPDAKFTACIEGSKTCYQAALDQLKAASASNMIRHVYTLETQESFGAALTVCPGYDKAITVDAKTRYWRLLLPASDPGDHSCSFTKGASYDLYLIAGWPEGSVETLLDEAQGMGMQVFVGMPSAPMDPSAPWDVWAAAKPAFLELAERVLKDYAARHGKRPAFAGVYQTTELPVQSPTVSSVLTLYGEQHGLVRAQLPGKKILVSPYWDARKTGLGVTSAEIKAGIKAIARKNVDIIAPQDGRGTGKVGLHWPYQLGDSVAPSLVPAVGSTTYGQAYYASTTQFYSAARAAVDELQAQEGLAVQLWANVEAFEPGSGAPCGSFAGFQRTSKQRLDRAVTFAGGAAAKVVSFMWDNLFTCPANQPTPLGADLAADWQRPLLVQALKQSKGGKPGITLRGYNITTGVVTATHYDAAWMPVQQTVPLSAGVVYPHFGKANPRYPDSMEEAWIPFDWSNMAPSFYVHLDLNGPGGTNHHTYSLKY